jgi:hypothetical protein
LPGKARHVALLGRTIVAEKTKPFLAGADHWWPHAHR